MSTPKGLTTTFAEARAFREAQRNERLKRAEVLARDTELGINEIAKRLHVDRDLVSKLVRAVRNGGTK